jgi:hypothetical protein
MKLTEAKKAEARREAAWEAAVARDAAARAAQEAAWAAYDAEEQVFRRLQAEGRITSHDGYAIPEGNGMSSWITYYYVDGDEIPVATQKCCIGMYGHFGSSHPKFTPALNKYKWSFRSFLGYKTSKEVDGASALRILNAVFDKLEKKYLD